MKITQTVPQQDVLLCMLHASATPGREWMDITDLVEAHYGHTTGVARQGRRQAMRNMLWRMFDDGLVLSRGEGTKLAFQLTPKAMRYLHPA